MLIKRSGWILLFLSFLFAVAAMVPEIAFADVAYMTNTKDKQGRLVWTQPAYVPVGIIGSDLTAPDPNNPGKTQPSPMQGPKDLFIDNKDHIYVADTGNNRIVEFDPDGKWLRYLAVPESPLNKPEGVFVSQTGDIYVADTGNKRVVHLDPTGKMLKEFKRPVSKFIPESFKYDPTRLVVDKRGFLYISVLGGYQGLLQLDPDGNFQSFYGANPAAFSTIDAIKRALYTKKMYANEISKLPGAISSVAVDKDGFLYTTTMGQDVKKAQIKRLNIRGINMLTPAAFGEVRNFEIRSLPESRSGDPTTQLIDLCVDSNGNITAIDAHYKYVSQYDAAGNLLFFWAGPSTSDTTRLGLMKSPIAIDANSHNDLYMLDSQDNIVQSFRLSEFGQKVNDANALSLQGRYEESEKPWQEVIRLNANYTPAILGLAKAAYKQGDYASAMRLFKQGGDHTGYSNAFWQVRLIWFQSHFSQLATTLLIVLGALFIVNRATRNAAWRVRYRSRERSRKSFAVQFRHIGYLLKHPIDGFSAIRYESKGGYLSAIAILLGVYLALIIINMFTGYTFNNVNLHRFNLVTLFLQFFLVWSGWVVSNYLVSSIYRGEGRFKDVFVGSAYALIPFVIVGIPLALVSNAMTEAEQAIYDFIRIGLYVWAGALFFWKIQSLQNYSIGETIVNVVLSLLAFVTLVILIMLMLGLSSDLKDFIMEIYQEARLR